MTTPLPAEQVAIMGEALADALDMVARSPPGTTQQSECVSQARDLYLRLGPYLLTTEERAGFPATDSIHKD